MFLLCYSYELFILKHKSILALFRSIGKSEIDYEGSVLYCDWNSGISIDAKEHL